jgi:hypothetical protein
MIKCITKRAITITLCLFSALNTFGQTSTWTGSQDNDWNKPANWSGNSIPNLQTNVVIAVSTTGNYPVIDGQDGSADCRNLTVSQGAAINLTGYGSLRISGNITAIHGIEADGGTVVLIGTAPQVLPADAFLSNTLYGLTIYNPGGVTLEGSLDLTGILTLQTGIFNTSDALTLKSTAASTAQVAESAGAILGNVTVERYIPARRAFRFLSAPTTGGTINSNWQEGAPATDPVGLGTDITGNGGAANGFDVSGSNNPSLFTHNNVTATWEAVTSTNSTLTAGTPYRILIRGDRTVNQASNGAAPTETTLRSTGTLVTGPVLVTGLNPAGGGFSFVGNPYQATVDMQQMLEDDDAVNVNDNFYYVWDPTVGTRGAYVTVNLATNTNTNSTSDANKYLHPTQAFFVQTQNSGQASLMFKEEFKVILGTDTPDIYKTTNNQDGSIALMLYTDESLAANGPAADGLVVTFAEGNSNGVDNFDAIKPVNQDENISLVNNSQNLSFESRALPVAGESLPIWATTYRTSNYTFKVAVNNIEGVSAFLQDHFTGTQTALQNNQETLYSFTVNDNDAESVAADRFEVVFQETLSVNDMAAQQFAVYPNPATGSFFNVGLAEAQDATITLYNQLGQAVATNVTLNGNTLDVVPQTPLSDGLYMVEITSGNAVYTSKIIVKN